MSTVSGDSWSPSRKAAIVEGIEYFNYTNQDIIVTDRLGIEMEILRQEGRPERLEDRGKVIVRVTRLVDPRRVTVSNTESQLECDHQFLVAFNKKIEELKGKVTPYASELEQTRMTVQIEMHFDFLNFKTTHKSNLLGITIRETTNVVDKSHGSNPIGYINDQIVKDLEEVDHEADNYTNKGIRTLFSARLIDNQNRLGILWTSGFGSLTKIIPVIDEEQQDGLYLAGGLRLQHKQFIPIEELLDPKKLLGFNLHATEREARKHTTGEYTISVMSDNDKLRKETKELKVEQKKLTSKVDELEMKARVEKLNRAQSDFKQTVTIEKLKEYRTDDYVSGLNRFVTSIVGNAKTVLTLLQLLKII
ncbi:hypothetical protein AH04_125 [Erwinia phage AH04]|uniref:Uncharacterized protein n=1 Tax=Erwinia phage AH04 TaxID=2869569 RepID=A0AAE7X231_9CAUD|nr:hypothetical protein PQC02_gp189 [Erwinia phage AH04]QZA70776.1 hypothetical protein AH04_125 [Erwinia phage AH04]